MRNKRFPNYPDDTDYTTNAPSYYDDLARKQKLIELLAKKIWEYEETLDLTLEEITNRLESYIDENDNLMRDRLEQWDSNLEKFPENVELLLQEWLSDGTLDHIINDTIFNWKLDTTIFEQFRDGVVINAMFPPSPFQSLKADANYYDAVNFKYYKDEAMTIPATDNRPALQALVDYAHSIGGATILIPRGKFVFRSSIGWKSKVSLIGAGKGVTQLFHEGSIFSLLKYTGAEIGYPVGSGNGADNPDLPWLEDCTFSDFMIDGKGMSYPDVSVEGKALFLQYMKRPVFRDLVLVNTIGTALGCDFLVDTVIDSVYVNRAGRNGLGHAGNSGIGVGTSSLSEEPLVITNCFVYNCGNYGIFVEKQSDDREKTFYAKIVNCHAEGNRIGFGNRGSGGTQFIGCTAFNNIQIGFHLALNSLGDQLIGVVSEENGETGIEIDNLYQGDLEIAHGKINRNGGHGIRIKQSTSNENKVKGVKITQATIRENGYQGILINGNNEDVELSGLEVVRNGQKATSSTQRRGIHITGSNNKKITISNCTGYDDQETQTQTVGIDISNTATDVVLTGCNFTTYTAANAYQIPTTGTYVGNNITYGKASGEEQFGDGVQYVYVNHYLGRVPSKIVITPKGSGHLWVYENTELNRMRIARESTTGTLEFMWSVEW